MDYCSVNQSLYVLSGQGINVLMFVVCNFMFEKRNTTGRMQCVYTPASDPALYQFATVQQCNSSNSMSFLDIKNPAERTALANEYVKAMKTIRKHNMVNREMELAIGEELQTLFHPIVTTTKQTADKTVEELVPVKKALEDIDGALRAQQQPTVPAPQSPPEKDLTFGIHATGDGWHATGDQYSSYRRKYSEGR